MRIRSSALLVVLLLGDLTATAAFSSFNVCQVAGEDKNNPAQTESFTGNLRITGFVGDVLSVMTDSSKLLFFYNRSTQAVTRVNIPNARYIRATKHYFIATSVFEERGTESLDVLDPTGKVVASSGEFTPVEMPEKVRRIHPYWLGVFEFAKSIAIGRGTEVWIIPLVPGREVQHIAGPSWETAVCNDKILRFAKGKLRVIYDDSGAAPAEYPCALKGEVTWFQNLNAGVFFAVFEREYPKDPGYEFVPVSADGIVFEKRDFKDSFPRETFLVEGSYWHPYFETSSIDSDMAICKFRPETGKWEDEAIFGDEPRVIVQTARDTILFLKGVSVMEFSPKTREASELLSMPDDKFANSMVSDARLPEDMFIVGRHVCTRGKYKNTFYGRGVSGLGKVIEAIKQIEGQK